MRSLRTVVFLAALAGVGCHSAPQAETAEPASAAPATDTSAAAPARKELPDILARVNDEPIERWEVDSAIREIELDAMHPIPAAERDQMTRMVLDRIIGHHLIAQESRARNLRVSEAQVDADIARLRKDHASEEAFNETLASFHTSLDQLRRQRRLSLEVSAFVRATIAPGVAVTKDDVEGYYRDNPERFRLPESVRASHILVQVFPDASSDQRASARAKASGILAQLRQGADFAKLAAEQSDDPGTRSSGGDLGTFPRGRMDPSFEAAAFALQANGLSDVVETPFGFHLIKVHEHHAARTMPIDEVRADITQLLTEQGQYDKLQAFIEQAKSKARIEIFI
jgi:parvulin-like peptidyl-prolyl isomerase